MAEEEKTHKPIYEAPEAVHAKSSGTSLVSRENGTLFLTFFEERLRVNESRDGKIDSELALAAVCTVSMTKAQAQTLSNNLQGLIEGME